MRVLIIDDEADVCSFTSRILIAQGYETDTALSYDDAMRQFEEKGNDGWDLILLDIMMPGKDGYELLRDVRSMGIVVPVIFLTGRGALDNKVEGLNMGADDYIAKPYAGKELIARIEAVLRRTVSIPVYSIGDLKVDPGRQLVTRGEDRVDMTPREFAVLLELLRSEGQVVSKTQLLADVWGMSEDPGTKIVEVQIARLRKKLMTEKSPQIQTVVGEGYRLLGSRSRDLSAS